MIIVKIRNLFVGAGMVPLANSATLQAANTVGLKLDGTWLVTRARP